MAEIRHIDAFEFYYSLGSARTYEQVAQKFNKSEKTIRQWGYKEKWSDEIKIRDREVLKQNRENAIKANSTKIKSYRKINEAVVKGLVDKLKKGVLDDKGVKSYLDVARFDLGLYDLEVRDFDLLIGETVEEQSAGDVNSETKVKEQIELIFDIKGGVSSED